MRVSQLVSCRSETEKDWLPRRRSKRAPRWSTPLRALGFGLLLILGSIVVTLVGAEIALRAALSEQGIAELPRFGLSEDAQAMLAWNDRHKEGHHAGSTSYPTSFDEYDPVLGWRVKENVKTRHVKPGIYQVDITTNESGMRGQGALNEANEEDLLQVAFFGCSQTFGETVNDEEVYVYRVGRELPEVETLNLGVRGYGTGQMLLHYRQRAERLDADIVVLAFAFYHIRRNVAKFLYYSKPYFELQGDGKLRLGGVPVPDRQSLGSTIESMPTWDWADKSVLLRWVWQRVRNLWVRWLYWEDGDGWALTRQLIAEFVEEGNKNGHTIVLMNIDERHAHLEGSLSDLAQALGVGLIDLGPRLRKARSEGVEFALPGDHHWNALGHQIVADAVRDYFCTKGVTKVCDGGKGEVAHNAVLIN